MAGTGQVALYIDWDNLAISTSAETGGTMPDVRRIVRAAQSYGQVVLARAYAEWGQTSDRLAVYRAGVDPVYAPTFRFEAEQPGGPRGKSLADPCLVADCVDALHLLPQVETLVLVSGDKDLIPIVRLAQTRGKRVVVIAQDMAAVVLREMADEFISYRQILGSAEARSTAVRAEVSELARRRRRRGRSTAETTTETSASTAPSPAASDEALPPANDVATPRESGTDGGNRRPLRRDRRERRPFVDRAGVMRPTAPETAEGGPEEHATAAPEPVAPAPPTPEVSRSDLFARIRELLETRRRQGRGRLRSTNLKDYLIAEDASFSERRYGFATIRDLIAAGVEAGALQLVSEGAVDWLSAPSAEGATRAPLAVPRSIGATSAPPPRADALPSPADGAAPVEFAPLDDEAARQMIRDVAESGRPATYGLVVSTLASRLMKALPDLQARTEAERLLDRLSATGSIRVDREPRELTVNGVTHRVRLVELLTADESAPSLAGSASSDGVRPRSGRRGETRAARFGAEIPPDLLDQLVVAVRESLPPDRDSAGAAGVKSRLIKARGTFDESEFGYGKFKDFLLAAEALGRVRVMSAGAATRVGLPLTEESAAG